MEPPAVVLQRTKSLVRGTPDQPQRVPDTVRQAQEAGQLGESRFPLHDHLHVRRPRGHGAWFGLRQDEHHHQRPVQLPEPRHAPGHVQSHPRPHQLHIPGAGPGGHEPARPRRHVHEHGPHPAALLQPAPAGAAGPTTAEPEEPQAALAPERQGIEPGPDAAVQPEPAANARHVTAGFVPARFQPEPARPVAGGAQPGPLHGRLSVSDGRITVPGFYIPGG